MDHRMSKRECAILQEMQSHHPEASGIDVTVTMTDSSGNPCFLTAEPAAKRARRVLLMIFRGEDDKPYTAEGMLISRRLFKWMGNYMPEKGRTFMFYFDPSLPADLVTNL